MDITHNPIHLSTNSTNDEPDAVVLHRLQKAACLAAGHQSGERYDAPKCHPETREAVINDIMSWVNEREPEKRIMWMKGPAGAGKSAIAQTVAERCYKENKLLSSFFFSRTATTSGRDDGARLVPTIACHLAIVPEAKRYILAELRANPAILSSSMDAQMRNLVVEPLKCAITARINVARMPIPRLVIVDGLDECNNPEVQSMILKAIAGILAQPLVNLRFLVASRPEWEIRKTFNLPTIARICLPLTLDYSYEPDKDIEIYLRSEFATMARTHPLGEYLSDWPSQSDINSLVRKSSGQFIYASTVIKYVNKDREYPRDRLQTILNVSDAGEIPGESESPYGQLDALYLHILSKASATAKFGYNSIFHIFEVLLYSEDAGRRYILRNDSDMHSAQKLADFLGVNYAILRLLLLDLHSILYIPSSDSTDIEIRFFHASFSDFMKDSSRSKRFFIPEDKAHVSLGHRCSSILSNPELLPTTFEMCTKLQKYAKYCYFWHLKKSNFDDELLTEIRSQDIRLFMHGIISGLDIDSDHVIDFVMENVVSYQVSTDDSSCFKIFPVSGKLRDMYQSILEAFDSLEDYSTSKVCWYIDWICAIRRDPADFNSSTDGNDLYIALKVSCMEDPLRGRHKNMFMCDETCRYLFERLCRNMITRGFQNGLCWDWIDVLKYLLGKIEPSYEFGIFLRAELPRIRSFLVNEPIRSRYFDLWSNCNLDLKKAILIVFKQGVYTHLKNCNVPIYDEIDFSSAIVALNVVAEELVFNNDDELEIPGYEY